MARTALTDKTVQLRRNLKTEVNNHKTTLDAIEAGTNLRLMIFTGKNGTGACTLTGAVVGQKVSGKVVNLTDATDKTSSFEATITVADQIQQSEAADLSSKKFIIILNSQT